MELHIYHHFPQGREGIAILGRLDEIVSRLNVLNTKEDTIIMDINDIQTKADDTLAKVTATKNVADAVKLVVDHENATIAELQAQVAALIAAGGAPDPAALQKLSDTLDAIQSAETANADTVAAAVTAGTPVATPTPTPTP